LEAPLPEELENFLSRLDAGDDPAR
jgi:hypothetical protein